MESYLLYLGAGALFASVLVGAIAVATSSPARASAARAPIVVGRGAHVDRHGPASLVALGRAVTSAWCTARLRRWLDRAGNPSGWPLDRVIAARGVGLLSGAVVGAGVGTVYAALPGLAVGLLAGALLGLHAPGTALWDVAARRQREIARDVRPTLELLTVAHRAGMGFDSALAESARLGSGPLADEVSRVLASVRAGESRSAALRTLASRTTVTRLRRLATALAQAGDLGAPLEDVVERHVDDLRDDRWQRAEALASEIPLRLLGVVLVCFVPAVLAVLFGPELLDLIERR